MAPISSAVHIQPALHARSLLRIALFHPATLCTERLEMYGVCVAHLLLIDRGRRHEQKINETLHMHTFKGQQQVLLACVVPPSAL